MLRSLLGSEMCIRDRYYLGLSIVGIIWRKPVLTHASIVFGGMLASVNSVNCLVVLVWLVFRHLMNELIIKSASRPCAWFTKRLYRRPAVCVRPPCEVHGRPCASYRGRVLHTAGRVHSRTAAKRLGTRTDNHEHGYRPCTWFTERLLHTAGLVYSITLTKIVQFVILCL